MTPTKRLNLFFYLEGSGEQYIVVAKNVQEHNHDAQIEKLHRQIVSTSCKRKSVLHGYYNGCFRRHLTNGREHTCVYKIIILLITNNFKNNFIKVDILYR